ncbi:hypothetical protein [Sulfobacillus harzensis]|uniref:Uncharacterized protein n=1 Tax=Sulfobacillus harzensis TaxID=2729629 RepID=A0A7Y0Q4C2_9FIRM|nr:hypothetical protein [Sulfobacillus harzensis]NMP23851.1 hypothetical protein [Sulfobacillus harzensis]
MREPEVHETKKPFNYAIYLYDMNADDVFDHDRHIIVDSSLGVIEEEEEHLEHH